MEEQILAFINKFNELFEEKNYKAAWFLIFDNGAATWECEEFAKVLHARVLKMRSIHEADALELPTHEEWLDKA